MAAPTSCFKVFQELFSKRKEEWEYESLKNFKLFCFILFHPTKQVDFNIFIEDNLHTLDSRTRGGSLIFFTLSKPTNKFIQLVQRRKDNREYINEIKAIEEGIGLGYNDDATLYVLCKDLGIPEEALPCLVITNDFSKDNIFFMCTNKRTLIEDLSELHSIAEIEDEDNLINAIRENKKFQAIGRLHKSFAEIIVEALSLNAVKDNRDTDINGAEDVAREKIKNLLEEIRLIKLQLLALNRNLNRLQDIEENEILVNYESEIIKLVTRILNNYQGNISLTEIDEFKNFFEPKSFEFLKSGFKVFKMFENDNDFDFSSSIMPFAKAFENEINHSLIQWVRDRINIKMPEYYCKYQPNFFGNSIIAKKDLNKRDENGEWKALAFGEAKMVLEEFLRMKKYSLISNKNKTVYFDKNQLKEFFMIWEKMRIIRNKAGHSEILQRDKSLLFKDNIYELLKKKYFDGLFKIKSMLRM